MIRIRWRGLELPTSVLFDPETLTEMYGKFVAEPFERGFGTTLGNSMRRILLSSLEGAAVTAIRVDGAAHEFQTLNDVLEDVSDIVLNVKGILIRMTGDETKRLPLKVDRKGAVTAGDIQTDPTVEIVNPDHHICTLTKKRELSMEFEVGKGRGYVTAEEHTPEQKEVGTIPVDALYSPVRRVRYKTEDTRVGHRTNYDRLVMEIWTNGVVQPEMAMVEAAKIFRKHLNPFVQYFEMGRELQQERMRQGKRLERIRQEQELMDKLKMSVTELDLSVRASNCLTSENIQTIGELVRRPESEMLKIRNFGKTSLDEIKKKLTEMGLTFGIQADGAQEAEA